MIVDIMQLYNSLFDAVHSLVYIAFMCESTMYIILSSLKTSKWNLS